VRRRGDPADRGAAPDCCRIVHRLVVPRRRGRGQHCRVHRPRLNTTDRSATNNVGGTARRKTGGAGGNIPARGRREGEGGKN